MVVADKRPLDQPLFFNLIDPVPVPKEATPMCPGTPLHLRSRTAVARREHRSKPIRSQRQTITNEWYKAQQLGDPYWLYVVWAPLDDPDPVPLMVQNPARHLDYGKREVVAARYFDIPAEALEHVADGQLRD